MSALESQSIQNVRTAREEEWAKLAKVEGERAELERTILVLKARIIDIEAKDAEHQRDSCNVSLGWWPNALFLTTFDKQ